MPTPTNPACKGSWPLPPPDISATLPFWRCARRTNFGRRPESRCRGAHARNRRGPREDGSAVQELFTLLSCKSIGHRDHRERQARTQRKAGLHWRSFLVSEVPLLLASWRLGGQYRFSVGVLGGERLSGSSYASVLVQHAQRAASPTPPGTSPAGGSCRVAQIWNPQRDVAESVIFRAGGMRRGGPRRRLQEAGALRGREVADLQDPLHVPRRNGHAVGRVGDLRDEAAVSPSASASRCRFPTCRVSRICCRMVL